VKKILLLLLVVVTLFVVWNRERLYLRDPVATVSRDGVKQSGVQVYINFSNEVLLESDKAPMYLTLVQHGQRVGTPVGLKCLHFVVCRTDSAVATMVLEGPKARVESMDSKTVSFLDGNRRRVVVTLH
jgi:hypothetical protein